MVEMMHPEFIEALRKGRRETLTWRCRLFGCVPDERFAEVKHHENLCRHCGYNLILLKYIGEES